MKRTTHLLLAGCVLVAAGLAGCSDDTETILDQGDVTDGSVDLTGGDEAGIDGALPDSTVDSSVDAGIDSAVPDMPGADMPGADMPGADMPGADMPGADMPGADMPGADTAVGDAAVTPSVCSLTTTMTLSGGSATATGTTAGGKDNLSLSASSCTGFASPGPDAFYEVALSAGKTYQITLTPASTFDSMLYVSTDCTKMESTCVDGDDNTTPGGVEKVVVKPTTAGTYYIGVDSYTSSESGSFTLEVKEVVSPVNDTCAKAQALSFTSGKATASGDNTLATNTVNLPSTGCTSDDTEGGDLFYSFTAKANQWYKVTVTPASGFNVAAYVLTSCTSPTTSCVAGADAQFSGTAETFVFQATSATSHIVGVDTHYKVGDSFSQGSFTLSVEELTQPVNDTCAKAQALGFTSGKATAKGDNTLATATVNLPPSGCTGYDTEGADLFYSFTAKASQWYKVKVVPDSGFNVAAYAFTSCSSAASTCAGGADSGSSGTEEVFYFQASSATTHYIGVDTRYKKGDSFSQGSFALTVEEVTPPTNDTCAKATTLTLSSSGSATASGDTSLATNTVNLPSSGCTSDDTEGPDVFYKVSLTMNKSYQITVTPASGYNVAAYVVTNCASAAASCLAGSDSGYSGTAETIVFTPTTSGMHYIGVDSRYKKGDSYSAGTFTIAIQEVVTPSNDTCAKATTLTLGSSGSVKVSGDTTAANNTINLPSSGCTSWVTPGPDLFYSITLPAGSYTVTLTPASGFDPAMYVFTSCSSASTTCVGGSDAIGSGLKETVSLTPTSSTTYLIGVDSYSGSESGTFSLEIK